MLQHTNPPEKQAAVGGPSDAVITVGDESTAASSVINVAIQLKDANGNDLAEAGSVPFYLSSDSAGQSIASAPSGGIAIGTDGLMVEWTANVAGILISEADGDIDIDFTDSGASGFYLNIVTQDGRKVTSDVIQFS